MDEEELLRSQLMNDIHCLSVSEATPDNLRQCSMKCRHIAISYFNQDCFEEAEPHCINGIDYLWRIKHISGKLADDDYRNLIDLYLDLSDIYANLNNISERDNVISFALKAFQAIQLKTPGEIDIGDPNINFSRFYDYFQRQLCTPELIDSCEYQNNQRLISEDVQQKHLLTNFNQTFFLNQHQQDFAMLQQDVDDISLSAGSQSFVFVADTDDQNYRLSAASLQKRADWYRQHQSISDAIKTYRQAIDALEQITAKSDNDHLIIQKMNNTLSYLSATMNDNPITEKYGYNA